MRHPSRWVAGSFLALAALSLICWWQIRLLGDLRTHLEVFYAWFAVAFLAYLAALALISNIGDVSHFSLVVILLSAVVFRLFLLGTTPTLSDDLYRYRWDGRVQQAGIDPYRYPPNAPELAFLRDEPFTHINFPHLRTVYPPLTALGFRLGTMLGGSLTAHKTVFVGAEALLCVALLLVLRVRGLSLLWVAAYAWHPLAVLEMAGSGHNDALGVMMLWWGIAAWESKRWWGAVAAWSLAFNAKFVSVMLAPWWWFRRCARTWLAVLLVLSAIPIACCPSMITALFTSLSAMTVRFESNSSVYLLLAGAIGEAGVARAVAIGLWLAFLCWWARRQDDPVRYVLGGCASAALLSPAVHPWYLVWLIPCFCFLRPAALMAWTATAILAYTVWPGHLAHHQWQLPLWARLAEYLPVAVLLGWQGVGAFVRNTHFVAISNRQSAISKPKRDVSHNFY